MALRDWSKAKFTFVIALPVFLVISVPMVVWSYHTEPASLSGDCLHVDQAMRHWMRVLPRIQLGLGEAGDTALLSDIAAAAAAIRSEGEAVQDPELRLTTLALADNLSRVSRGSPSSAPNGFPDRDYVGGMQDSMSTGHALKLACPGAVDDPISAAPRWAVRERPHRAAATAVLDSAHAAAQAVSGTDRRR